MRPSDPRVLRRLAPARGPLAGVLAGGAVTSVLVVAQAFTVTALVVALVDRSTVALPALLVALVVAARAGTGWVVDACAARAAATIGTDVRRRLVERALSGRPTPRTADELAVLTTRGVAAVEPYLTRYLPALVLAAVLPVLTVAVLATQDLLSAVIVLLTLPLVPVFAALVGLATRDRARRQWRAMESLSGHFLDVVRGLPTLVCFGRAEQQSTRIRAVTERYRVATLGTLRLAFASSAVLELVATLSVALVAVTVGVRLAGGDLTLSTGLVALLLAPEAYWPLRRVGAEFHAAAEGVAAFEAVSALLDDAPVDGSGTGHADATARGADALAPLVLDHVTLTYPGRTTPALAPLSLVLPARGVTALAGPSGCGKSTLLAVLAGLREPTAGTVRRGAAPVAGDLRREQVALLPQRPVFVAGTIGDNLRLGRPDASDDAVWAALRRVALEERVRDLPDGLDSPLGEDGTTLSAGERARLALARVVVADRAWLLLDEPTAHLDTLTEQVVADVLVELGREHGVVVVAHRPLLLELADRVVTLDAPSASHPSASHPSASQPAAGRALRTATGSARTAGGAPEPDVVTPAAPGATSLLWPTVLGGLASASGVALTATAGWLIVQAAARPPVLTLLVAIVAVRTFGLARPVLRYVERLRSHDVALRLLAERRVGVYDALVPLTPGRLGRRRGDLLASVVDDVDSVVDRALRVRMPLRAFVVVAALASLVATAVRPAAGALVGATCLVAAGAGYLLGRLGARRSEAGAVAARAALAARVVATTQVADEIVMWQAGPRAAGSVARASDTVGDHATRAAAWLGAGRAAALALGGAGVAGMGLLLAPAVAAGETSAPMAALLVLLPLALADAAVPLADAGALAARTAVAEARLDALAARSPAVHDPAAPVPFAPGDAADLAVRDVVATWGSRVVLDGLSLDVAPGRRVGVVGPSGSGKTTLAALLLRFVDPRAGRVDQAGLSLRRRRLVDVRARTGLVDDDPHLFATSVAENVRLARPAACDAEVEAALRRACLGPWLDALPGGLGTRLGEGGSAVSGGERARLGVARSVLADQPVLVLDEPTAHLDHATATRLAEEVLDAAAGRTVVWITHEPLALDRLDDVVDLGAPHDLRDAVDRRG